jgi:hypothetical protein
MKNKVFLFSLFFLVLLFLSNSSQPGIWKAGGSGSFKLLYPEDSTAYKKIQMQSERVFIQLYRGFAVVKGEYFFNNSTNNEIKIKVGYPINNVFPPTVFKNELNQVVFDDLYKIKGYFNDIELPLFETPNKDNENWYVWELTFPPNKTIKFDVHFLVNTNNSKTVKGYTNDYKNAFIYLIETGSLWKSPIEKGDFYIQFMDEIIIENCKVSAPSNLEFNSEHNLLHFQLTNYGLKPDDNFIITYVKKNPDFIFKEVINDSEIYFTSINSFSNSNLNIPYESISLKNPYEPESSWKFLSLIFKHFLFLFRNFIYSLPVIVIITLIILRSIKKKT